MTGHSYVVYGPLASGATSADVRRSAELSRVGPILGHYRAAQVTILYTAPTAIRAFIKWGEQYPLKHDLSSLRLLGTVGEPINPEAWMWYHEMIGKRTMSDHRHVVADRDRRDDDLAFAGSDADGSRNGDTADARDQCSTL